MELAGPELIFVSYPQSVFRKIRIRKILPYPPYKEFFGNRIPIRDIPYFLKQCAQALSVMNPPWLWSILFFLTLFVLGIDSVFSSVEVVNTTIADFKFENARPIRREIIALFVCLVSFGVAQRVTTLNPHVPLLDFRPALKNTDTLGYGYAKFGESRI